MKYAFQKIRLEAGSFYALINNWVETQLIVSDSGARIIGYGYAYEIAAAFSDLVLDWEAAILLSQEPGLETGQYDLSMLDEGLFAFKDQQRFPLADQPVVVEVVSVEEED
jgi:hypothetical protein